MEGIELLNHWRKYLDIAIKNTFEEFKSNKKLILTESDLKCHLYYELLKLKPTSAYSVHSEVTHYFKENGESKPKKRYRFRDMALLNLKNVELHKLIWSENEDPLSKGFRHRGEAILIELKFDRRNPAVLNPMDIENLIQYRKSKKYPKKFYIIWGSLNQNTKNLNKMMNLKLNELIKKCPDKSILPDIYGVVFDSENFTKYEFKKNESKIWEIVESK